MADALALLVAGGFALMGAAALARPAFVLEQFGVAVETAEGRNEVSAVYGGFGLAVAAVLAVTTLADSAARAGVALALAVALGGMAAGRLIAAARERPRGAYPVWTYFAIELAAGAALVPAAG